MAENFERKTAIRIKVKDLVTGEFIKSSGDFEPSFVRVRDIDVGRANIMGIVVQTSDLKDSVSVDDGTGIIDVRSFNNDIPMDFSIGDKVNVIGKPREFGDNIFISCEIIKKIGNPAWLEVRRKELAKEWSFNDEEKIQDDISPPTKVIDAVRTLDSGDGADFESIVERSGIENAEQIINSLLEEGELFEVRSGKLKVLE